MYTGKARELMGAEGLLAERHFIYRLIKIHDMSSSACFHFCSFVKSRKGEWPVLFATPKPSFKIKGLQTNLFSSSLLRKTLNILVTLKSTHK